MGPSSYTQNLNGWSLLTVAVDFWRLATLFLLVITVTIFPTPSHASNEEFESTTGRAAMSPYLPSSYSHPYRSSNTTTIHKKPHNVTIDVFIRTYLGDAHFLTFALLSLDLFGSHLFRIIHIAAPRAHLKVLRQFERNRTVAMESGLPPIVFHPLEEFMPPYWQQMFDKLRADLYSSADFIFHMDSDCVLTRPLTLQDLFDPQTGKVIVPHRKWAGRPQQVWQWRVNKMLRMPNCTEMFMVRLGVMYPRWIYREVRKQAYQAHNMTLRAHLMLHPYEISEFESLGLVMWAYHHDAVQWLDLDVHYKNGGKRFPIAQTWSHGGMTPGWVMYCDCVFRAYAKGVSSDECYVFSTDAGEALFKRNPTN